MVEFDLVGKVVDYGDNYVVVEPLSKLNHPKIISIEETYSYIKKNKLRLLNNRIYRGISKIDDMIKFGIIPLLGKVKCTKYIMGDLLYKLYPTKISNVYFDFSELKLHGDVVVQFHNNSTDNYEGYCYVRRLEYLLFGCPEDDSSYTWAPIPFNLSTKWAHKLIEPTTNIMIANYLLNRYYKVNQGKLLEIKAHWELSALSFDFLKELYNIFIRGKIKTYNGFDVNIAYEFPPGTKNYIKKHINMEILLPIEGNITVKW